jgi:phosphoserine phosphatase
MQKPKVTEEENAEIRYRGIIEKRNELNDQAREFADLRDTLNNERRDLVEEIMVLRDERDALVKKMREHKKIRNGYQDKAKALIEAKKGKRKGIHKDLDRDIETLRTEVKMIDLKQQTTVLTIEEENQLLKNLKKQYAEIKRLESVLGEQDEIISQVKDVDEKITLLFKMADEEHEKVVAFSNQSQEVHDRITLMGKSITHLISEANKNHQNYVSLKERADQFHQKGAEMREKLMAMRNIKKDEIRESKMLISQQNKAVRMALNDEKKLEAAADSALETLLKKGKLEIR